MSPARRRSIVHNRGVRLRTAIAPLACAAAMLACAAGAIAPAALAAPASAGSARSTGTAEQIAWVRSAASDFVSAEIARDGAGACAKLTAAERASVHGRTCEQRWDVRLASLLRRHGERGRLRTQLHAIATAPVQVHGNRATIALATPLLDGASRLLWTENCWMLVS